MKLANPLLLLCLLLACTVFGQQAHTASGGLEPWSQSPVAALAAELTAPYHSQREKVGAIFSWITSNIDYKVRSSIGHSAAFSRRHLSRDVDTGDVLRPLDLRVAERVLETREAVCDGYARLFKTLCTYAGIRAEVVSGYARGDGSRIGRNFKSNHSWNAVLIDSTWHLVDATWASGYVSYRGDQFFRNYDSRYFLTPPQQFITDHFPEDPTWALLPKLPALPEFNWAPFRQSGYVRNRIGAFSPQKGVLEAAVGDTIWIELETDDAERNLEVWDQPFGDPRLHTGPVWRNYPERTAMVKGRKVRYAYTVAAPHVEWLYVVYNGEPVLRYHLKVRPAASPTATTFVQ